MNGSDLRESYDEHTHQGSMNQKVAAPVFLMPSQKTKKMGCVQKRSDGESEILSVEKLRVSQFREKWSVLISLN